MPSGQGRLRRHCALGCAYPGQLARPWLAIGRPLRRGARPQVSGQGVGNLGEQVCPTPSAGWGPTERRRRYANDLGSDVTLVGVTARSNRQKSDQDPATWMPAAAVHCRYIGEWVATKHRWGLAVDQAAAAVRSRLSECQPRFRAGGLTYGGVGSPGIEVGDLA